VSPTNQEPRTYQHYIDGEWTTASDGAGFEVMTPFSGAVYARAAAGTAEDAEKAVTAADRAFPHWAALSPEDKQQLFLRAAEIVERRRDELALILAEETGSSLHFARFQQNVVTKVLRQAAGWVFDTKGEVLAAGDSGTLSIAVRRPLVVLADTDLDYAVRVATYSAFFHQGQICLNARKVLIERPLYEEFVTRLAERTRNLPQGDPMDPGTVIGPLINDRAVEVMQDRIKDAVAKGAKIVTGGGHKGRVHEPTILVDVPDDAIVSYEETFGPLLVVQPVDSADEAVEAVNRSLYGLTASVLTGDTYRGLELARRITSGMVHVNGPTIEDAIETPIGGVRNSGWGRHGGHAREDLTDLIWINARNNEVELPI
jgi:acyl-CoA reductase-like NAD-dependent aldehyde dehydrogenase